MKKLFTLLLTIGTTLSVLGQVTTNGGSGLAATYPDLASAITALNGIVTATTPTTITLLTGNPQTAPAGGYVINATGTAANPITIVGAGAGSTISANTAHTVGRLDDAIFKIVGGDYITIDGFKMQENAANTTIAVATNNATEWGIALLYASLTNGAQNNIIQNNIISLNRLYLNTFGIYSNTRHAATTVSTTTVTAEVTTAAGSNSFNKIYANAISNVNFGIVFIGAGTTIAAIDNGNDIGGSSAATGNTITNWGFGGATASVYSSLTSSNYCIFLNQQINDNVSYNTVTSALITSIATVGGILKNNSVAIPTAALGNFTTTINNNTVTVTHNPTAATSGTIIGINSQGIGSLLATATINMNNNTVQNCVLGGATATTPSITAITNLSFPGTLNMTGNNVLNNSLSSTAGTTGSFNGVTNSGSPGILNISSNNIIGNAITSATATTGGLTGISTSGAATTANINSNIIRGFTSTANAGQIAGIINSGAVVTTLNINNNQFGNATSGFFTSSVATSGSLFGISTSAAAATCALSIQTNDIRGITYSLASSASQTYITAPTGTPLTNTISNNTFTNLNVNTTGSVLFIGHSYTMPANGTMTINNNSIVTAFVRGGATGSVTLTTTGTSSPTSATLTQTNNNFSNITVSGSTTITGFTNFDGSATSCSKTVTGNTFNNWTGGTGAIVCMTYGYWGLGTTNTVSNNTLTNITNQAAITGISLGSSATGTNAITLASNTLTNLTSTGAGGSVVAINTATGATPINVSSNIITTLSTAGTSTNVTGLASTSTTLNVFKNNISDLNATGTSGSTYGMNVSGGTTASIYNNFVSNLKANNNVLSYASIFGISSTATTNNIFYNTVYIGSAAAITGVGASGIVYGGSTANNVRNNIVNVNVTAGAANNVTAIRKSGAGTAGTAPTSTLFSADKNIYYTPISANNYLYVEGTANAGLTNGYALSGLTAVPASNIVNDPAFNTSCGLYKTFMVGRESGTFNENNLVANGTGFNPSGASFAESGGVVVSTPSITDDYAGTARGTTPDMGALMFSGTATDAVGPTITYTVLTASACPPTLTATIVDASGVNTTATTKPRLWYKRTLDATATIATANNNTATGWKYVEASNAVSPFTFPIDYSLLDLVPTTSDNIQYFVVAQDNNLTVNVGANAATFTGGCPSTVDLAGLTVATVTNSYAVQALPTTVATAASVSTLCVSGTSTLSLTPTGGVLGGMTYQWEASLDGSTGWANASGTSTNATYTTATLTANNSYRCVISCNGSPIAASPSSVATITVNSPVVTPASTTYSVCGANPVNMSATPSTGATVKWYAAASGGAALASGNTYAPTVSANTTYYAAASVTGATVAVGPLSISSSGLATPASSTVTTTSVTFVVNSTGNVLKTLDVYPSGTVGSAYALTIAGPAGFTSAVIPFTSTVTGTIGAPVVQTVAVNTALTVVGTYTINMTTNPGSLRATAGAVYPYTSAPLNITTVSAGAPTYSFFHNWQVESQCESARQAIAVTYTTPPVLTLSSSAVGICTGATSAPVTVAAPSPTSTYDTYTWMPSTGVSGNATTGFTFNPSTGTSYTLTAAQTSGGLCSTTAALAVSVNALPTVPTVTPATPTICAGATQSLAASNTGGSGTAIVGTGTAVTLPTSTTATYMPNVYGHYYGGTKVQSLILASELTALGLSNGSQISSVAFEVGTIGAEALLNFKIKMGSTALATFSSGTPAFTTLSTTVYSTASLPIPTVGFGTVLTLSSAFTWDGSSNIIIETSYSNADGGNTSTAGTMKFSTTTFNSSQSYRNDSETAAVVEAKTTPTYVKTERPNIRLVYTSPLTYTWSPTTNLFTDAAATIAYTGTAAATVYAKPTVTTPYTATATNGATCTNTNMATVTVTNTNTVMGTGMWNTAGTWSCGVVPIATTNVTIPSAYVVTLDLGSATINDLTFTGGGKLKLGANSLTANGTVTGDAMAGYVVTDGAGQLKQTTTSATAKVFPIGTSTSSYDPITITPTTGVPFGVTVKPTITNPLGTRPGSTDFIVSREWDITPTGTPGATTLAFTADAMALNATGTAFDFAAPTTGIMGHWNTATSAWDDYATTYVPATRTWTLAGYTGTFSPFIVAAPDAVLAVEFTTINAQAKGSVNEVTFTTATEKDVKAFSIERSINNKTWDVIGTKVATGGSSPAAYSFTDNQPAALSYYRVRSFETSGKGQLSKVVAVKRNGGKLAVIAVSPMPTFDEVNVDFSIGKSSKVTVMVMDIVGKVVRTETFKTTEGANAIRLDLSNLAQGTYIMTLNDGETMASQRIVKQ
jgi:Ig-like domain CHU_C associated/Secretion system C-terminal sorting domain